MARASLILTLLLIAAATIPIEGAKGRRQRTRSLANEPIVIPRGDVPHPPSNGRVGSIPTEASKAANAPGVQRMPYKGESPHLESSMRMAEYAGAGVDTHFEAIDGAASTPPDPHFAVGKKGMVMTVNGEVALHAGPPTYNRIDFITLHEFFDEDQVPIVYDPRAVYNHYSDRYLVIALRGASSDTGDSSLLMALSKTDEPTSVDPDDNQWIISSIDTDVEVPANTFGYNLWADYPTLGYDEYNAYVGFNMFQIGASAGPIHAKLFAIKWDDIEDANSEKIEWMRLQDDDAGMLDDLTFTPQPPIRYHTPGATTDHITISHSSGDGDVFLLYRTENPQSATPTTRGSGDDANPVTREPEAIDINTDCPGSPGWTSFGSDNGQQAGSDVELDVGDARLLAAFHRDDLGLLYASLTARASNGVHTGVMVIGLNTTTIPATCIEAHLIEDVGSANATENWYFGYPSVAITDEGDIGVAFTGVREASFGSVFTAYKVNNTWSPPLLVQEGIAPYTRLADVAVTNTRWGDYSQTVIDPNNGNRIWGFVQYAGQDPDGEGALWYDQTWTTRVFSYELCSTCTVGGCEQCENTSPCFLGQCVCDAGLQSEGYDCPNLCPQLCFADEGRGSCDYKTRKCTCNSGWVGDACENADPVTLFIFMGVLFVVVISMMMLFSACHPEYASIEG